MEPNEVLRRIETAKMARQQNEKNRVDAMALDPGTDWAMWILGQRVFRVSPDNAEARELQSTGLWTLLDARFVLLNATKMSDDDQGERGIPNQRIRGSGIARNLNDNVLAEAKELDPGDDWPIYFLDDRIFRVSPNKREARELES